MNVVFHENRFGTDLRIERVGASSGTHLYLIGYLAQIPNLP